ncbi:MAG: hypothetical protein GX117_04210 [Candidatus Hydrogenedentes bacterium]|jgi:uncharacterized protein YbaR (Trm112 family)|nr:hypothetical protein [Candidatus Hydrogenedentota bacterium]
MVDPELLKILVCPENRSPLHEATPEILAQLNEAIAKGTLRNRGGEVVQDNIDAALIRQDEKVLYIIQDAIPYMLIEKSIVLDSIKEQED